MATNPKPRVAKPPPAAQRAQLPPRPVASIPKRIDPSSPEYKRAARKYTRLMIAMPILLVTSWVLFDRLLLGGEAKTIPKYSTLGNASKEKNKG
ncbi:hypothetical protein F4820DRAFT_206495 [Hypoxylon rubiginosum]|uniref:Uncharacterized protein n=1 Tax=Hypoxylon rubiginosum TaxID=110542 RepID=A0ACB9YH01_9PEZI|nr:hypothetical protein F4820DRAFT_206495 [Hypoxylon rubiginosum]